MQSIDGRVGREFVIRVLQENGVSVSQQKDAPTGELILAKNGVLLSTMIPTIVGRRMIHTFARKFSIAIHLFYN